MKNRYIHGVEVPRYDGSVEDAMSDSAQGGAGGNTMLIAVENEQGEVYRVFETTGLGELLAATEEMALMDFIDVLYDHASTSREGYDCRFRPPGDIAQ